MASAPRTQSPQTGHAVSKSAAELSPQEELSELEAAIDASRYILALKEDWDGAGSPGYDEAVWQRAVRFLRDNTLELWTLLGRRLGAPTISPGPEGGIDMRWRDGRRHLLMTVPASAVESIEFYGDDRGATTVKGKLHDAESALWLLMWLTM
jgi:hypothetical protein